MSYLELLKLASPEATVVVTALIVLTIGLTRPRAHLLATVVAALGLLISVEAVSLLPLSASLFHGMSVITELTSLFKIICLALAFSTVLLAHGSIFSRNHAEYLAMILLATVGLMLLVGSEELLMIFIGLELTGLSLYVLTGFNKDDPRSAEAGLKYFLFGSTASAFTLFGLSLIYGLTGTTSLAAMNQRFDFVSYPLIGAGLTMTLVGFAFKIAAAPFHLWAPDAYQAAPIPSAAFIASGSKVASFVVLGKVLLIGFASLGGSANWHAMFASWEPVIAALAALSIVIGNFVALVQTNVRRLLAYSAVAHAGYTLLGLLAGGRAGFSATLFYTVIYAFTLLGAFGVVAFVRRETGGDELKNFAGLNARSPLLAGCFAIFILSLAGLPPLAGFFGKFYLFSVAFGAGANHSLLWLVALALFGSLISLYYYLIVLKAVFFDEPGTYMRLTSHRSSGEALQKITIGALASIILLLGLMPALLLTRILAALQ